ncbi:MAG: hypothetical protein ABIB71_00990 [Candidatus Woesearchaeota archaeon]
MIEKFIDGMEQQYNLCFSLGLKFSMDAIAKIEVHGKDRFRGLIEADNFPFSYNYHTEGKISEDRLFTLRCWDELDLRIFSYRSEEGYEYSDGKLVAVDYSLWKGRRKETKRFTGFKETPSDLLTGLLNFMYSASKGRIEPINFVLQGKVARIDLEKRGEIYVPKAQTMKMENPEIRLDSNGLIESFNADRAFMARKVSIKATTS